VPECVVVRWRYGPREVCGQTDPGGAGTVGAPGAGREEPRAGCDTGPYPAEDQWRFTTQNARTKLHRLYPPIPSVTGYWGGVLDDEGDEG